MAEGVNMRNDIIYRSWQLVGHRQLINKEGDGFKLGR